MMTLKLGKTSKVLPLPATEATLRSYFLPIVKATLGGLECVVDMRFVEHMPTVDGMMFYVTVEPVGTVGIDGIKDLIDGLDQFCTYEKNMLEKVGGRDWRIGDGDDSGAVFFEEGKFNIWLRGWPPCQE